MSRVRRQALGVALFPFLAVLICTMGALIVLLVLMVAKAGVDAEAIVAAETDASASSSEERRLREQQEDAQWRRELLEQQRAEKTQELADRRQELAHLEDHFRRLEQQARQLIERAKEIDKNEPLRDSDLAAARAQLQKLQADIARKKAELAERQKEQTADEGWYALIPYDGPNGTRRRPIYIECTQEGVILQPEGVILTADDFNGPLGPGNPLDAALRATREHMLKTYGQKAGEPYPLLVVRPRGIIAYGVARAAMKSWEDEFGYELISDDKKLSFGASDPVLSETLLQTIAVARQRQEAFIAAMPRRFNDEQPLTSFAPESLPDYSDNIAAGSGRSIGSGVPGGTRQGFGSSAGGAGIGDPFAMRGGGSAAQPAGNPAENGGPGSSLGNGQTPAAASESAQPANGFAAGAPQSAAAPSSPNKSPADAKAQAASGSASPNRYKAGQPGGTSSIAAGAQKPGAKGASATKRRGGTNWALPAAQAQQTGITRPIQIACLSDRIVIVPERGDQRSPQVVEVSPEMTPQEIDAIVSAVQQHMRSWGLAVANGYWKPELKVEVAPDAEQRFAELQTALQGSGFDLQRKIR